MAGLPLFVGRTDDEVEYFKNEIQNILKTALSSIKLKENGVHVQASTLGSLEALLEFLKTSNIPVKYCIKPNTKYSRFHFVVC
jgi:translation initiation factor 5B